MKTKLTKTVLNTTSQELGRLLLDGMLGDRSCFAIAADLLTDTAFNNPEVLTYVERLNILSQGVGFSVVPTEILFCFDVLKKFGTPNERKAVSKLVRTYHKLYKRTWFAPARMALLFKTKTEQREFLTRELLKELGNFFS